MRKLRSPRYFALSAVVAALALLAALPAVAMAAETGAETPSGPTESTTPETTSPPPVGWVPQGSGGEESAGGSSGVRHGSSLGSGGGGGGSTRNDSAPAEQPSYEAPSSESGYDPQESSPAPTGEEVDGASEETSVLQPVEPPPPRKPARPTGIAGLGDSVALTQPEVLRVAGVHAESAASSVPLASQGGDTASGPDFLWWIAIAVCGLLLVYAGARLILEPTEPFKR